jgi:hypothetical protein
MAKDFAEELDEIKKMFDAACERAKVELGRVGAAFLNSGENKEGFSFLVFGGGTPSFNDGDPCVFLMYGLGGVAVADEVIDETIDELSSPSEAENLPSDNPFAILVNKMEELGMITDVFDAYGFIAIVKKDGSLIEKEYALDY